MPQLFSAVLRKVRSRRRVHSPDARSGLRAPRLALIDRLEGRVHFSVTQDAAGFTVVTPGSSDRVVYVSSSGNDSNYGLSNVAPVRTLAKARSMLRSGYGDQMLLRRGDTFYETLGTWTLSGRSASEPMVIGTYGTGDRPVLATGKATALTTGTSGVRVVNHLVLQGIRFWSNQRDPSSGSFAGASGGNEGLRLLAGTSNLLVEDIEVDSYATNITVAGFQAAASNIRIRRSVIVDAYNTAGNSEGIYVDNVNGFTLEDNVFDHNGWNDSVSGGGKTQYNHNIYIKETVGGFVARGNLIANASSHGMQARAGGIIENNTFLDNPIHISFGLVNGGTAKPGGVNGRVSNNVFQGGGSIGSLARGWAMELSNIASATVNGNVFTDAPIGSGVAISLNTMSGLTNAGSAVGVNNLLVEGNVINNWTKGLQITESLVVGGSGVLGLNNFTFRNNDIQNSHKSTVMQVGADFNAGEVQLSGNRYHSPAGTVLVNIGGPSAKWYQWAPGRDFNSSEQYVTYPGGTRDVGDYGSSIGVGSAGGYVAAARNLGESNWRTNLLGSAAATYIRNGFGLTGSTSPLPPPTVPPPPPTTSPPPPPSTGAATLRPVADAFVRDGSYASKNFGTSGALEVRKSGVSGNSRSVYLKFDISQISRISTATLYMNGRALQSGSMQMQVFAAASDNWSPTTLTWNNQPGTKGTAVANFNAAVTGSTPKNYTANLSQWLMERKAAGEKTISLVVLSPITADTAATFASTEGGLAGPYLAISG